MGKNPDKGLSLNNTEDSEHRLAHFAIRLLPNRDQFCETLGVGFSKIGFFSDICGEIIELPLGIARPFFPTHLN